MTLKAAVVGLGKMGLSHYSILNTHPEVTVVGICDTSKYMLEVLGKHTGVHTYSTFDKLLSEESPDCVFVATPSRYHTDIVSTALDRGLHVFCEKPFALE